jgi:hypothetical protein
VASKRSYKLSVATTDNNTAYQTDVDRDFPYYLLVDLATPIIELHKSAEFFLFFFFFFFFFYNITNQWEEEIESEIRTMTSIS